MRILKRPDFIALPGELLYAKYEKGAESLQLNIRTKERDDPLDWMRIPLNPADLVDPMVRLTGSQTLDMLAGYDTIAGIQLIPEADNELGPDDEQYIVFSQEDVDEIIMRLVEVRQSMKKAGTKV